MFRIINGWFARYFSDPQAVLLMVMLLLGFGLVVVMGDILAPVIASIIIAYLLQWWITLLEGKGVSYKFAYWIIYLVFLAVFVIAVLILLPLLWRQCINLLTDLPGMLQSAKITLLDVIEKYPAYFSEQQIEALTTSIMQDVQGWAKKIVSVSLSSIPGIIVWLVYIVLVPLLVLFFLKDKISIIQWFISFLPQKRNVLAKVWNEMDRQIGNYIRGKITEITIVGIATYIVFLAFGLRYPVLLATLVGLSVVIPYIGAVIVTIPVILVGYLQWGFTAQFGYMLLVYEIVQILDGNILVPVLFSEAVNLHPIAIIVAVLVFGSFWGFWGVFFAIPLATLVRAVLNAWPARMAQASAA